MPVKQTDLVIEVRSLSNLVILQHIQIDTLLRRHELPPTARPPAIHAPQELRHKLSIITDHPLHDPILAAELKLVAEVRQFALHQIFCRSKSLRSGRIWRRNAEDRSDELGVPLCNAIDGRTTPVMAAEDDLGRVGLACNGSDDVGVGAEPVIVQVWGEALDTKYCVSLHCLKDTGVPLL